MLIQPPFTCAGNLDSPLHFLSSQAVGSMLDPPKLAACTIEFLKQLNSSLLQDAKYLNLTGIEKTFPKVELNKKNKIKKVFPQHLEAHSYVIFLTSRSLNMDF